MNSQNPKILLICLTRRGGLLQFNNCLANALAVHCRTALLRAEISEKSPLNPDISIFELDTGIGKKGTIQNLFSPRTWNVIRKAVKEFQPDIVHITSAQEWNPCLGLYFRYFVRKPLVYTVHDVVQHDGIPLYFRITETIFRTIPKYFVVLSEQGKKIICQKRVKPEHVLVVPHGIYDFFTGYQHPEVKPEKEILFFGRIEPYKGLNILFEAIKPVFQAHPDWKLRIAGGGDMQPYQKYLPNKNILIENRFLSNEEVADAMSRASMVVLPYLSASQSGVIPTAFAFSRPVIVTNVGSIPDMIQDHQTGLLISPGNPASLTKAIMELISSENLRQKLGQNGRKFADESLGWDAIAMKHLDFYQMILSDRRK